MNVFRKDRFVRMLSAILVCVFASFDNISANSAVGPARNALSAPSAFQTDMRDDRPQQRPAICAESSFMDTILHLAKMTFIDKLPEDEIDFAGDSELGKTLQGVDLSHVKVVDNVLYVPFEDGASKYVIQVAQSGTPQTALLVGQELPYDERYAIKIASEDLVPADGERPSFITDKPDELTVQDPAVSRRIPSSDTSEGSAVSWVRRMADLFGSNKILAWIRNRARSPRQSSAGSFSVLCVCSFNYNRSPAVHMVLRELVSKAGLELAMEVDSGAVEEHNEWGWGLTNEPLAAAFKAEFGKEPVTVRSRSVTLDQLRQASVVIVADEGVQKRLEKRFPKIMKGKMIINLQDERDGALFSMKNIRQTVERSIWPKVVGRYLSQHMPGVSFEMADALSSFGIDLYEVISARPLGGGVASQFKPQMVTMRDGRRLVLRKIDKGRNREHLLFMAEAMIRLSEKGLPVPRLYGKPGVPTDDPAGYVAEDDHAYYMLETFLDKGRAVRTADMTPAHYAEIGRLAARVNNAFTDFKPRAEKTYIPREELGKRAVSTLADYYKDLSLKTPAALSPGEKVFMENYDFFERQGRLFEANYTPVTAQGLPRSIIHNDMHSGNIQFNEKGEIVALFDFDFAMTDVRVLEFNNVILGRDTLDCALPYTKEGFLAAVDAYQHNAARPLSKEEIRAVIELIRLRFMEDVWYRFIRHHAFIPMNVFDHPAQMPYATETIRRFRAFAADADALADSVIAARGDAMIASRTTAVETDGPTADETDRDRVRELFAIVESSANNRRAALVEQANRVSGRNDIDRRASTIDVKDQVSRAVAAARDAAGLSAADSSNDTIASLEKGLQQLDADSVVSALVALARRAQRQDQRLIIGLETDWIPGMKDRGYGSQHDAITPLVREIERVGDTLRSMGLTNVSIIHRDAANLADELIAEARRTHTTLANVIVLASKDTIARESFAPLRDPQGGVRPFLTGVDPSALETWMAQNKRADLALDIGLLELLSLTLELAVGKEPPQKPNMAYDAVKRVLIYTPIAQAIRYDELKSLYDARRMALASA